MTAIRKVVNQLTVTIKQMENHIIILNQDIEFRQITNNEDIVKVVVSMQDNSQSSVKENIEVQCDHCAFKCHIDVMITHMDAEHGERYCCCCTKSSMFDHNRHNHSEMKDIHESDSKLVRQVHTNKEEENEQNNKKINKKKKKCSRK